MDAVSISKLPQDVWERVKLELVRVGLEEAEISLSKEAAVELREGTLLNFVGKDEPFKWSEEMYSDDFDWEKFVEETGGALGTFKEAKGAVVTVKNHVEVAPIPFLSFSGTLITSFSIGYPYSPQRLRSLTPFNPNFQSRIRQIQASSPSYRFPPPS